MKVTWELVIYTLQTTGLTAKGFPCAKDFWNAMKQEYPSLVLLDIMLPDEDGLTILKKLRDNGPTRRLPVIMLTAKGTEYDKVLGLDSGADDYIPKPFGMMGAGIQSTCASAPDRAGKTGGQL